MLITQAKKQILVDDLQTRYENIKFLLKLPWKISSFAKNSLGKYLILPKSSLKNILLLGIQDVKLIL